MNIWGKPKILVPKLRDDTVSVNKQLFLMAVVLFLIIRMKKQLHLLLEDYGDLQPTILGGLEIKP